MEKEKWMAARMLEEEARLKEWEMRRKRRRRCVICRRLRDKEIEGRDVTNVGIAHKDISQPKNSNVKAKHWAVL